MIASVVVAVVGLGCLSAGPAMALMGGDECSGTACEVLIGCDHLAPPPLSPTPSKHPMGVLPLGHGDLALKHTERPGVGPPEQGAVRKQVAPLAPRSPPTT